MEFILNADPVKIDQILIRPPSPPEKSEFGLDPQKKIRVRPSRKTRIRPDEIIVTHFILFMFFITPCKKIWVYEISQFLNLLNKFWKNVRLLRFKRNFGWIRVYKTEFGSSDQKTRSRFTTLLCIGLLEPEWELREGNCRKQGSNSGSGRTYWVSQK